MTGTASGNGEIFEFTITPVTNYEFRLDIRYSGDGEHNITGAGLWPTVQKARAVAETIAQKRLGGAQISWVENL